MSRPAASPPPTSPRESLLRSGASLAAATLVSSLLSYAFNLTLTRALGPESFGAVGALLGAAVIGSVPATALQLEVARLVASGESVGTRWLIRRAGVAVSALTLAIGLALVPVLDQVLRLSTPWDAAWLALLLFPQTLTGALLGLLLGHGRLGRFSVVLISVGLARLAAAVATQAFDGGTTFALSAAVAGAVVSMLIGAGAIVGIGADDQSARHPSVWTFSLGLLRATSGAAALMVLLNADLLAARALLDDNDSGQYAFLTTFGRVTFWGTSFLSLWVFPRVAGTSGATRAIRWSLAAVAGGGVVAVAGTALLSHRLVVLLAGPAYVESAPYVAAFALAGALISVIQLGTYIDVARSGHRLTVAAVTGAGAIAAGSAVLGISTIWGIISLADGVLALLTVVAVTSLRRSRPGAGAPDLTTPTTPGQLVELTERWGRAVDLGELRDNWDELGRLDPLWAILADPQRHGNRWAPEDFFITGEVEVRGYLHLLGSLGIEPGRLRALDFGSGAGRLTQALSATFTDVLGLDVAQSMTALAIRENARRTTHAERVSFRTNPHADLRGVDSDSVDLVLSIVVLQHMRNELKCAYIAEFVRVLRPGGVALFTVPSHADWSPSGVARRLPNRLQNVYRRRRYGYHSVMEFHAMRRATVEAVVEDSGGALRAVRQEPMAGPPWTSYLYVVTKPEA